MSFEYHTSHELAVHKCDTELIMHFKTYQFSTKMMYNPCFKLVRWVFNFSLMLVKLPIVGLIINFKDIG